jgi:tight adherence protein B
VTGLGRISIALGAALGVGWLLAPLPAVAVLASAAAALAVARSWRRGRRRSADAAYRLAVLRTLAAELESGSRPADALLAAAAVPGRLAQVFDRAARSADRAGSILQSTTELREIGYVWWVGETGGVALAGVLRAFARDARDEVAHRARVASLLAGPRASAVLVAALPALGIGLGAAMGAQPLRVLLHTPGGVSVGCVGVVFDALGVLWFARLLRAA